MLYGLLVTIFIFISFLLVAIILLQQGKGSMGLGSLGGSAQLLFGGSGGQDIFQKATWILGGLFMMLSLGLALTKARNLQESGIVRAPMHQLPISAPEIPSE